MKWREYKFKDFLVERNGKNYRKCPFIRCTNITEKVNSDLFNFGRLIDKDIILDIKWYRSAEK